MLPVVAVARLYRLGGIPSAAAFGVVRGVRVAPAALQGEAGEGHFAPLRSSPAIRHANCGARPRSSMQRTSCRTLRSSEGRSIPAGHVGRLGWRPTELATRTPTTPTQVPPN